MTLSRFNVKPLCVLSLMLLGGCSTYQEHFDCDVGKGVGCKSLSYVNRLVDRGDLPYPEDLPPLTTADVDRDQSTIPLGYKMWVAGYRDNKGYYHSPSYIHLGGAHD